MNRMYLEHNNAGRQLLITDGFRWWYFDGAPSGIIGDIDFYRCEIDENGDKIEISDEILAEDIRKGITTGAIYSADDFISEIEADPEEYARNYIPEYDGISIDDIDARINYCDGYPKGSDTISWIEI